MDTDYDNYAIVYLCDELPMDKSKESFWLLSRTKTLNPSVKEAADGLIDKYFDRKSSVFITTDHGDQ